MKPINGKLWFAGWALMPLATVTYTFIADPGILFFLEATLFHFVLFGLAFSPKPSTASKGN